MASQRQVKCPTCGAQVAWNESSPFRPFCSQRCRTIDLGDWAAERHRIAGDPTDAPPDDEPTSP
jgi:uncharacterized protein